MNPALVDPALLLSDIRLQHNLEDQERSLTFPKTTPGKLCSTFYLTLSDSLKVDLGPLKSVLSFRIQILLESTFTFKLIF